MVVNAYALFKAIIRAQAITVSHAVIMPVKFVRIIIVNYASMDII